MNSESIVSAASVVNSVSRPEASASARLIVAGSPAFDPNLGVADRVARMLLGFAALSQAASSLETLWAVLGIGLFATGLLGLCPVYPIFGWCTRRAPTKAAREPAVRA
jgi:hypothetical protein